MATRLEKTIKRELDIDGKPYTVTISPEGVKITPKGGRKGPEMTWRTLLMGEGTQPGTPEGLAGPERGLS
ncbi:MAG TPA: hypothetical protein VNK43_04970 [Gemmatimonadales bacterium]|nr:hypothetical protein [Gemmatimonadales bacterium]